MLGPRVLNVVVLLLGVLSVLVLGFLSNDVAVAAVAVAVGVYGVKRERMAVDRTEP